MPDFLASVTVVVAFILWYIYSGYLILLRLLFLFKKNRLENQDPVLFKVTVLLTVRNEERSIIRRINNLLSQNYPMDLLEVLVASDGSTDATNHLVSSCVDDRIKLFVSEEGRGKTATQNDAMRFATGDIIIFTDAGSCFEENFIARLVMAFSDSSVGAADGHLLFAHDESNLITQSQGFYWRYELALRQAETRLGMLAVASGACLAVRKSAFREMEASIGEDCIIPLDVIAQGLTVVHVPDAVAYDTMENDHECEFRTRVRMTQRNWQGTWSRPQLLNPILYPRYAFSLWSHKLLRWTSPFFIIILNLAVMFGVAVDDSSMKMVALALLVFYILAFLGWWAEKRKLRIPLVATIYSFMLANAGFMVGVSKAMLGRKIYKYR